MRRLLFSLILTPTLCAQDLPWDPAVSRGVLENGVRWGVMHQEQPATKVSIRVQVNTGSLDEQMAERGMAHFLEHMAFNGTKKYPGETLVQELQRRGVGFGSGSNAFTSFDRTVYMLDLPDTTPETLRFGLDVLVEQTQHLSVEAKEVERERGIILAEMRDREGPGYREWKAWSKKIHAGHLIADREPIGIKETVSVMNAEQIRAFYQRGYRPDLMSVAVVGAMSASQAVLIVKEVFGGLKNPENPAVLRSAPLPTVASQEVLIHQDPEATGTRVRLERLRFMPEPKQTLEHWTFEIRRDLAEAALRQRLKKIIESNPNGPLLNAGFHSGAWMDITSAGFEGTVRPGKALEGWRLQRTELERMLRYGPTAEELRIEIAKVRQSLEQGVSQAAARSNAGLASGLVDILGDGKTQLSPEDARRLGAEILDGSTAENCLAAFKQAWDHPRVVAGVLGKDTLSAKETETLQAIEAEIAQAKIDAPAQEAKKVFAYGADPGKGNISTSASLAHGIQQHILENGVVLQILKTTYQREVCTLDLALDTPSNAPAGIAEFARYAFTLGGLGKHSLSDLAAILAGTSLQPAGFAVGDFGTNASLSCQPKDLLLAMQLTRAFLTDPGWRSEAESLAKGQWLESLRSLDTDLRQQISRRLSAAMARGESHLRPISATEVNALTLPALRAWLQPHLESAPLTITICGDLDPDRIRDQAVTWFGSLPKRPLPMQAREPQACFRPHARPFPTGSERIDIIGSQAKGMVFVAWQAYPAKEALTVRTQNILARVFGEYLRRELRETLGQAYSPHAWSSPSSTRDEGAIMAFCEVAPENCETVVTLVHDIAARIVKDGIEADLFTQVREPILKGLSAQKQNNGFWRNFAVNAYQRPWMLEWPDSLESGNAAITAKDIQTMAAQVLLPSRAFTLIGTSKPPAKE